MIRRAALLLTPSCLAVLLATGPATGSLPAPAPEVLTATTEGSTLRPEDLRVATIGYRLALSGRALCPVRMPVTGMLLHHLAEYERGDRPAMLVAADLGVSPWTVFAQGLSVKLPISIGEATFLLSAVVLLLWIPLREKPGLGTIGNAILVATSLQVMVLLLPEPSNLGVRFVMVFIGIALIGLGSGLYLTTNLGPGPRDGWMTGIHIRTGWPISAVRLGIEAVVLVIGWLFGGTVGIGTVLFALLIGPSVGYGLRLVGRLAPGVVPAEVIEDEHPELEA